MKVLSSILWLFISITYGLAPFWSLILGFLSVFCILTQLINPGTPIVLPILCYLLFFLSFAASGHQYGGRGEATTSAPPP